MTDRDQRENERTTLVNVRAPDVITTSWRRLNVGLKNFYDFFLSLHLFFLFFVMKPGAQAVGNIAGYGSVTQLAI